MILFLEIYMCKLALRKEKLFMDIGYYPNPSHIFLKVKFILACSIKLRQLNIKSNKFFFSIDYKPDYTFFHKNQEDFIAVWGVLIFFNSRLNRSYSVCCKTFSALLLFCSYFTVCQYFQPHSLLVLL